MKKSGLILAGVCLMAMSHSANAAALPSGTFDDSASFVIAKAVKLGRGHISVTSNNNTLATGGTSTSITGEQDNSD